jgi:hypothetical protein
VYAEDSFGGFLPQAGTATYVRWPTNASGRPRARERPGRVHGVRPDARQGHRHGATARRPGRRWSPRSTTPRSSGSPPTPASCARWSRATSSGRHHRHRLADGRDPRTRPRPARASWRRGRSSSLKRETPGPFASAASGLGADPAPVGGRARPAGHLTGRRPPARSAAVGTTASRWCADGNGSCSDRPTSWATRAAVATARSLLPCPAPCSTSGWPRETWSRRAQVLGVLEADEDGLSLKARFAGTVRPPWVP